MVARGDAVKSDTLSSSINSRAAPSNLKLTPKLETHQDQSAIKSPIQNFPPSLKKKLNSRRNTTKEFNFSNFQSLKQQSSPLEVGLVSGSSPRKRNFPKQMPSMMTTNSSLFSQLNSRFEQEQVTVANPAPPIETKRFSAAAVNDKLAVEYFSTLQSKYKKVMRQLPVFRQPLSNQPSPRGSKMVTLSALDYSSKQKTF